MYGGAVVIGVALAVMALALLSIWRRERIEGPTKSRAWRWFYRALTFALVLFAAYMLAGFFLLPPNPPP
jgi:cytochrome bd-type quinol oxidase subunit 2